MNMFLILHQLFYIVWLEEMLNYDTFLPNCVPHSLIIMAANFGIQIREIYTKSNLQVVNTKVHLILSHNPVTHYWRFFDIKREHMADLIGNWCEGLKWKTFTFFLPLEIDKKCLQCLTCEFEVSEVYPDAIDYQPHPMKVKQIMLENSKKVRYTWTRRLEFKSWTRFSIFIIKGFRAIVFIFIVISTTFRSICPPAFRCLSNSGTFTELRTTSFIESTRVACSDSVSYNQVQVLSFPVLLLACSDDWTCNLQMI